jgi:putative transposase
LREFSYVGAYPYHLIIVTDYKRALFTDEGLVQACVTTLVAVANERGFEVQAYCFMPDHLHLLLLGKGDDSDLLRFVQRFKQSTSFSFKKKYGFSLWEQSFYDRALRNDEHLATVADFIFRNPVEAGLASEPAQHAYSGGQLFAGYSDGAKAASLRTLAADGIND